MKRLIVLAACMGLTYSASAQKDTSRVKFAPGTLVGKYYGTYDTSAKKPEIKLTERTGSLQTAPARQSDLRTSGVAERPQLQANQNVNPIEVSGTNRVTGIETGQRAAAPVSGISVGQRPQLQVNQNYNPIEVSGTERMAQIETTSPQASITSTPVTGSLPVQRRLNTNTTPRAIVQKEDTEYIDTRLGSSSPLYDTYEKNAYGAGSVTTNQHKGGGGVVEIIPAEPRPHSEVADFRNRLGSSSPLYDSYEKNAYGAGSITTNQNKSAARGAITSPQASPVLTPAANDSTDLYINRLGSSSPQYDTYEKNAYGAGAVTTNQNKRSGNGVFTPAGMVPDRSSRDSGKEETAIKPTTRLGSSSPDTDTYEKNKRGAGAVTTNPNKRGGGVPVTPGIQPEKSND